MRIVAIGNCHIGGISSCIRVSTGVEVKAIQLRPSELWWETCLSDLEQADMIAVMSTFESQVKTRIGRLIEKIKPIPHILTHRFHPDLIYINTPTGLLQSVMHVNHSAIVAYCYLNNVSESEVPYWFNESNFKALGYLNKTIENDPWLAKQEELTKYPVKDMTSVWARRKAFVHTPNHPIMEVFQDIALHFAKINSIPVIFGDPSSQVVDRGARHSIWPV